MSSNIGSDMTKEPVSITGDVCITDAREIMRSWGMRHLPIVSGVNLIGVVSDRDILRALALLRPGTTPVSEIMSKSPYRVHQDASIKEVAKAMADNKYGCAVITGVGDSVIGIFTTVDALNLLARLLNEPKEVDHRVLQLRDYLAQRKVRVS